MLTEHLRSVATSIERSLARTIKADVKGCMAAYKVLALPLRYLLQSVPRKLTYNRMLVFLRVTADEPDYFKWLKDNPCWYVYVVFANEFTATNIVNHTEHWGFVSSTLLLHVWGQEQKIDQSWCISHKRMSTIKPTLFYHRISYEPGFYGGHDPDTDVDDELVRDAVTARLCVYAYLQSGIPLTTSVHDSFLYPLAGSEAAKADAKAYYYIAQLVHAWDNNYIKSRWTRWETTISEWRVNFLLSTRLAQYSNLFEFSDYDHVMEQPYTYPGGESAVNVYRATVQALTNVHSSIPNTSTIVINGLDSTDIMTRIKKLADVWRINSVEIERDLMCPRCRACQRERSVDEEPPIVPMCIENAMRQENQWKAINTAAWYFQSMPLPMSAQAFAYYWSKRDNCESWRQAEFLYRQRLWSTERFPFTCKSMQKQKLCPYTRNRAECINDIHDEGDMEEIPRSLQSMYLHEWKHTPPALGALVTKLANRKRLQ